VRVSNLYAANAEDNPRSLQYRDLSPETPFLEDLMQAVVRHGAMDLRVAFPAQVVKVDAEQTVDVQPSLKTRPLGQDSVAMPQIQQVPVSMPQGADWRLTYPVAVGDTGLCICVDRNIEAWLAGNGGLADPGDTRIHNLNDAIFVPGLVTNAAQSTGSGTDMVLQNGDLTLRLSKNGTFSVSNKGQELVSLLDKVIGNQDMLIDVLKSAQVLTALGPAPFLASTLAQFEQLGASLDTLKTQFETFKGT
jgi:hypothetical protein